MDIMELRRGLMMQMAGSGANISPWSVMKVTASQNYATNFAIKEWFLELIQDHSTAFMLKDNPINNTSQLNNEFISMMKYEINNDVFYARTRSNVMQVRSTASQEDANIISGETFTIFYQ